MGGSSFFPNMRPKALCKKELKARRHGGVVHPGGSDHAHQAPHIVSDVIAGHHHAAVPQGLAEILRADEDLHLGAALRGRRQLALYCPP